MAEKRQITTNDRHALKKKRSNFSQQLYKVNTLRMEEKHMGVRKNRTATKPKIK